ncbi:threonine dehydratase [Pseudoduganella sp. OTU4001]|uniref:threonine dehydratase n=1 Tax=Pseudoduganella sp. OTU4001 TaxID=3043854 RepID=UPI00313DEBA5
MNLLPSRNDLDAAAAIVYGAMPATPQFSWPLLNEALGTEAWVKHENHTPTGAFKVRGGLVYLNRLLQREPGLPGVISATRGNHGQSIAFASRRHGVKATIVVPHGNSAESNAAMRGMGAELIEYGDDFQASREYANALARKHGLHMVPPCHPDLVAGVASYWMELFHGQPALDTVFVPIGQGSGFCAAIAAREALGLRTRVVGVVSSHATGYLDSFRSGELRESPVSTQLADGMACRRPDPGSLELVQRYADDVVTVSDEEVARAIRLYYRATHNLAEGAGAAALAAALRLKHDPRVAGQKVGLPLTGANLDAEKVMRVLSEVLP